MPVNKQYRNNIILTLLNWHNWLE